MKKKDTAYPQKRKMNLYYKPDKTTKPATIALYVLFVCVVLLGLGKFLIYDIYSEVREERATVAALEDRLNAAMIQLADYAEVKERYNIYSATEEEAAQIDRMEILALLDSAFGGEARLNNVAINGDSVIVQFYGTDLARTAEIVDRLEQSPLVAGTTVNTAYTTQEGRNVVSTGILIELQKEAEAE